MGVGVLMPVVSSGRTNYCVAQDLVAFGVDSGSATTQVCDIASRIVDNFCGTTDNQFGGAVSSTKKIYDVRNNIVVLPTPFSNVTALSINGSVVDPTQYSVVLSGIRLYLSGRFDADGFRRHGINTMSGLRIPYGGTVEVTATFGYQTVPGPVFEATKRLAARLATETVNDLPPALGIARIQVEAYMLQTDKTTVGNFDTTGDETCDRLLAPYRVAGSMVI